MEGGWTSFDAGTARSHFFERLRYDDSHHTLLGFVSELYVSAEAAEAAARVKFKLTK
jgi:hypothetical protein